MKLPVIRCFEKKGPGSKEGIEIELFSIYP